MIPILLGSDLANDERVYLDPELFRTHFHLIGATGSGKSTALLSMVQPLLMQPGTEKCCLFLIDPMGNLSRDLLRFIAHPRFCPQHVRDRLVYIEPANENYVLPFNPLTHTTEASRYYQTMRSVDIVLRAWAAQDVSQQPRLLQWTYKAFCAAAMLGYPIAMCRYLLHPGQPEHEAILHKIPGDIRFQWQDILQARGSEATRILESARNRLDPFFESVNLRRMFGARTGLFDCERFIRERKVVIVNLAKYGKIPGFISDTIGSLVLNEIVETANRMSTRDGRSAVDPTYVVMDEFQKYVGVDIEDALPTVRQMGLRLILAHQSFSQLELEDVDLTQMIWQARSRLMFTNSARDADLVADELAKLTFDSMRIKDMRTSRKQLIVGYRKEWLDSVSSSTNKSHGTSDQDTIGYNQSTGETMIPGHSDPTRSRGHGDQNSRATGRTSSKGDAETRGQSQANVPIHDTFEEVTNVTYQSFEEWSLDWGKRIRQLRTGEAFAMFANNPGVHQIAIEHLPIYDTRDMKARVEDLLAKNYESEFFLTADAADREIAECRRLLLQSPPIVVTTTVPGSQGQQPKSSTDVPFR